MITEQGKSSIQTLHLSCKALAWLTTSFNSLFQNPCNHNFSKKLVDDNATLRLEKLHNKNGSFTELTHLYHTGQWTKLFITSDDQKQGWFSFFPHLFTRLPPPPYKPDLPATKLSFNPQILPQKAVHHRPAYRDTNPLFLAQHI